MRTLRMAFVGGFAGASMAGNVATLHAAPFADQRGKHEIKWLPTVRSRSGGRLARRGGHKWAACLEGG